LQGGTFLRLPPTATRHNNLTQDDNRINRSGFHLAAVEFGLAQISGARRLFDRIPETTDRRMKEH
jgi:hypothetical protein